MFSNSNWAFLSSTPVERCFVLSFIKMMCWHISNPFISWHSINSGALLVFLNLCICFFLISYSFFVVFFHFHDSSLASFGCFLFFLIFLSISNLNSFIIFSLSISNHFHDFGLFNLILLVFRQWNWCFCFNTSAAINTWEEIRSDFKVSFLFSSFLSNNIF